ncbi:MAG TPA: fumarylacetoacetate hydrolase family protein [Rhizomicrobium sp.]|jgi:2-keto-4-pentenoate hydratase/2-oxohepta-3-ene-1,7-dioic acid hydratase in catechol pathway|nr:fumarylacetoacetate hydrolase family protein [Rhizomicrobium sp.]
MADFKLLNYAGVNSAPRPAILVGDDTVVDLQEALPGKAWAASTLAVLGAWDEALPALKALAGSKPAKALRLSQAKLLAPLLYPPAIYCTGANYMAHAEEMSAEGKGVDKTTTQPYLFLKSGPHCVIGPGDEIRLPGVSKKVDWEGEFAVVIGRRARNVKAADAMRHVAGYTIMNDLSARDLSRRPDWPRWNIDWFGHKNFETAAPMGPWITPMDQIADPYQCRLQTWVNQEKMQDSLVSGLIFNIEEIIDYLSRRMTLLPGDVIATGTPSGVGRPRGIFLKPGDRVRIEIAGIGTLENPVVQGE